MSCEKFYNWLNEGNSVDEVYLPDELRDHLHLCIKCQQLLESHNRLIQKIDQRLKLSSASRQKIFNKLEAQIDNNANLGSTLPERLARLFHLSNRMSLLATGATVFLLALTSIFLIYRADETGAKNVLSFSGSGTIQTEDRIIALTDTALKLTVSQKIHLVSEEARVFWNDSPRLVISGNAEFIIGHSKTEMLDGRASIHFEPSTIGYMVEMRQINLYVTGTRLMLSTCKDFDEIIVERGKISWQLKDSEDSGVASEGMRLKIVGGRIETSLMHEKPTDRLPANKPFSVPSEPEVPPNLKMDRSG